MYSKVMSGTWEGIEGILIQVEADISNGLPVFEMVGYLSSEVKEAKERVRTALKNQGYSLPPRRIVVNLAPANLRKSGSIYDLAVGISVLMAAGLMPELLEPVLFLGEVGLDGSVKPVQGVLPIVMKAKEEGIRICIVPEQNRKEAKIARGILPIGVTHMEDVVKLFLKWSEFPDYNGLINYYEDLYAEEVSSKNDKQQDFIKADSLESSDHENIFLKKNIISIQNSQNNREGDLDFADIKGQALVKRALEIAVSGHHNIILSGSPGSGKSALAKRIPTIMPELTYDEQLEITRVYSVSGKLRDSGEMITRRPFRDPHHSITISALTGGGKNADPGEISLAHKGVLFLDELPEFQRTVLDMMRQPMENGKIVVSRNKRTCTYPADFMLVAAMNPCPCGYYPNRKKCFCSENKIKKYTEKISGPLLDRVDMLVNVYPVPIKQIRSGTRNKKEGSGINVQTTEKEIIQENHIKTRVQTEEASVDIRKRVEAARIIQRERYLGEDYSVNAHLTQNGVEKYCRLSPELEDWLMEIIERNEISYRGYVRILKLARTIADMDNSQNIEERHLTEAVMFRMGWQYGM